MAFQFVLSVTLSTRSSATAVKQRVSMPSRLANSLNSADIVYDQTKVVSLSLRTQTSESAVVQVDSKIFPLVTEVRLTISRHRPTCPSSESNIPRVSIGRCASVKVVANLGR